jgi:hypothetical protein
VGGPEPDPTSAEALATNRKAAAIVRKATVQCSRFRRITPQLRLASPVATLCPCSRNTNTHRTDQLLRAPPAYLRQAGIHRPTRQRVLRAAFGVARHEHPEYDVGSTCEPGRTNDAMTRAGRRAEPRRRRHVGPSRVRADNRGAPDLDRAGRARARPETGGAPHGHRCERRVRYCPSGRHSPIQVKEGTS